jgi:hypothetical protein
MTLVNEDKRIKVSQTNGLGIFFDLLLDERENAQAIFVCCVSLVGVSNEVGRPQATPFASVYFPLRPFGSGVREEGEYSRYGRVVNRDVSLVVRGLSLEIGKDNIKEAQPCLDRPSNQVLRMYLFLYLLCFHLTGKIRSLIASFNFYNWNLEECVGKWKKKFVFEGFIHNLVVFLNASKEGRYIWYQSWSIREDPDS